MKFSVSITYPCSALTGQIRRIKRSPASRLSTSVTVITAARIRPLCTRTTTPSLKRLCCNQTLYVRPAVCLGCAAKGYQP